MKKFSYVSKKLLKDMGAGGGGDPTLPERVTAIEDEIGTATYTGNSLSAGVAVAQYLASTASSEVNAISPRVAATPNGSTPVDISNGSEYTPMKDGYVFIENLANSDNDYYGAYIKTGDWGQGFRIGKLEGSFALFVHAGTVIQIIHTNTQATTPQTGRAQYYPLKY